MNLHRALHGLLKILARHVAVPLHHQKYHRFTRLWPHAAQVQRELLFAQLERCRDTQFGRDHRFADIHTLSDFRRHVPVAGYDYFAPYIHAVAEGNFNALFPSGERVPRFTITTGSTSRPKLNPVTTTWLKAYRHAWEIWGIKLFVDHPCNVGSCILQMAGSWDMGRTPAGIPISMVSALVSRHQNPLVRPFYAIPHEVADIGDAVARYYAMLRLSINKPIGFIMLMNPGTLLRLARVGDEYREQLIRDIHDGTLSATVDIPAPIRQGLCSRIGRRNPSRARELESIVRRTGRMYPKDYWPAPVIACWLGGTAGYQSRYLREYFGDAPLRDIGLVSSEGRHTIPVEDGKPEGVLAITTAYYEFIPRDEITAAQPVVIEAHELEIGHDYYLLMTTLSGYYRFNIGDVVRCRGFLGQAPLLEFLHKGERCGDLEGEKVTEHQFVQAANEGAGTLGITLSYITAVPFRPHCALPCYAIIVEQGDVPDAAVARQFLESVDRGLMASNFLYSARRREGVLGPPRLVRIPTGAWARYVQTEIAARGTGDAHYKHPGLVQDANWLERFRPVDIVQLTGPESSA